MAIVQRVMSNKKLEEQWYATILNKKMTVFKETQKLPVNELNYIVVNPGEKNSFMVYDVAGLPTRDDGYVAAVELNYRLGVPLFACSFSAIVEMPDAGSDEPMMIFYITFETALRRERQIFSIEKDDEDKMYFKLNEELSRHVNLPTEINRFNFIIQPNFVTMN